MRVCEGPLHGGRSGIQLDESGLCAARQSAGVSSSAEPNQLNSRRVKNGEPATVADEELVGRAQRGDRDAFGLLVERYKEKAYRIAYDFVRDREEAKDLSQEAFLRAFVHLNGFDMRSSFFTWFYRIVVNLCVDHRRRSGRAAWVSIEESAASDQAGAAAALADGSGLPEERAGARELARKAAAILKALPPKQQTAFLLRNNEGLTIKEIAKIMGTAEGTVKAHLHRAVASLKKGLLGGESDSAP